MAGFFNFECELCCECVGNQCFDSSLDFVGFFGYCLIIFNKGLVSVRFQDVGTERGYVGGDVVACKVVLDIGSFIGYFGQGVCQGCFQFLDSRLCVGICLV